MPMAVGSGKDIGKDKPAFGWELEPFVAFGSIAGIASWGKDWTRQENNVSECDGHAAWDPHNGPMMVPGRRGSFSYERGTPVRTSTPHAIRMNALRWCLSTLTACRGASLIRKHPPLRTTIGL